MDQTHQSNSTTYNTDSAEHFELEPVSKSVRYSQVFHGVTEDLNPPHGSDTLDFEGRTFREKMISFFGVLGRPFGSSVAASTLPEEKASDKKETSWQETFFAICDFLACPLVYFTVANANKNRWEALPEEKKIFIYKKRSKLLIRNLVHALPFSAALTLVVINCIEYNVGSELQGISGRTTEKMFALVVTAKLHELLMLVSLSTIITTRVRRELIFGRGLPFGAIFSPHRFQSPGFLLSKAFSGVCFRPWARARDKWWFVTLILLSSALAVLVGPASYFLMRPRRGEWSGAGTPFWMSSTHEQLNPTVLNSSHVPPQCLSDPDDLSCPSGGWRTISDLFLSYWPQVVPMGSIPDQFLLSSQHSERMMRILARQSSESGSSIMWGYDATAELGRLWSRAAEKSRLQYREDALFSVHAPQPMVLTRCQNWDSDRRRTFPIIGSARIDEDGDVVLKTLALEDSGLSILSFIKDIDDRKDPLPKPSVTWTDGPSLMERLNASIASLVVVPTENSNELYCCSIFAAWMDAHSNARWSIRKIVDGCPANAQYANRLGAFKTATDPLPGDKPIKVMGSWALRLFPFHPEVNSSIFDSMARSAGLWNTTTPARSSYTRSIVETLLAASLADGISRTSYHSHLWLDLLNGPRNASNLWGEGAWRREFLRSSRFIPGGKGEAFHPPENPESSSQFNFNARVIGLAYTGDGVSVQAMIAVLITYMLIVIYHLVLGLVTELSLADWSSAPDVTVLAMTATRTKAFRNTGAGIDGLEAYEEKVQVRAVDGNLKMFIGDHHEDGDMAEEVKPNQKYG